MTTRQVSPEGLGARTTLDLSGTERRALGLGPSKDELMWIREHWAQISNAALREAGVAVRIDHRGNAARGVDREPWPQLPQKVFYAERTGRNTELGDRIRANYRERVEARLKGSEALARVVKRQREENRQRLIEWRGRQKAQKEIPRGAMTREQRNEKRREWGPDLEGFLKFASIPDWTRVTLVHRSYPTIVRSRRPDTAPRPAEPESAPPVVASEPIAQPAAPPSEVKSPRPIRKRARRSKAENAGSNGASTEADQVRDDGYRANGEFGKAGEQSGVPVSQSRQQSDTERVGPDA
jgi:hypothetical protein